MLQSVVEEQSWSASEDPSGHTRICFVAGLDIVSSCGKVNVSVELWKHTLGVGVVEIPSQYEEGIWVGCLLVTDVLMEFIQCLAPVVVGARGDDCERMQELCNLLEAYINWKHIENVFWAWMDSVVDCHVTDKREACLINQDTEVSASRSRAVCDHGNQVLESFNNMLLGLLAVQEMRGQRGEEEPRCRWGTEREDKLLAGSHSKRLPDKLKTSPPSFPSLSAHVSPSPLPQAYRLRLQGETKTQRSPAEQPSGGAPLAGKLQASQLLLQTEASLLERRERSRRANRMQLQEMIGRLHDLVLIAP
ncbi:hypothetical protein N1851_032989 [Merluccius polli]|uniref:Tubulin epsilon and delta complex protein 1 domain-containing protein n=1 Tax=Merluccius polli TaxID=89951 RepID=A0AA47M2A4_MERPO|nr:hypothetical protein N1851_032989 [Merluccius polli]